MPKTSLVVQGHDILQNGVRVALLVESPRFKEHYRVVALDGTKIGYVYRPFIRPNWKLEHCSKASYRTLEAALAAMFSKLRRKF